jgi:proprotein convertase subtilisin/kexin type 5
VTVASGCPVSCAACVSLTNCSSCQSSYFLQSTPTCQACPYDCLSCDSTGGCFSCDGTVDFRTLNSTSHRCVPLPGYYESGVTVSVGCPAGCATCQNALLCLTCQTSFYLRADNLCYSTCPSRFFPNTTSLTCQACPYDCLTYDSTGGCLSCDLAIDHRQLYTGSGRCNPVAGYFQSSVAASSQCPAVCATCSSTVNCSSCSFGFFLSSWTCGAFCRSTFYPNATSRVCEACPTGCQVCTSLTVCTVCSTGYFLQSDKLCQNSCTPRFYGSSATTLCTACPFDCLTCDTSGLICLSCDANTDFRTLGVPNSRCAPMAGHFENSTAVAPQCPAGCSLCSNLTFCSACFPAAYLQTDNLCHSTCPARFFPNTTSQVCQACPYDCLTCGSTGICLGCDGTVDFRTLDSTSGRCVPKAGYF